MITKPETKFDSTFLTRTSKLKSQFEKKMNDRFGTQVERAIGLPTISPQLEIKKKEMQKTSYELEETRTKYESWKLSFQKREKELEEKIQSLNEQKRNLDNFSQHHSLELKKANERIRTENELAKKYEAELAELTKEEEALSAENDKLHNELKLLEPYNDYLQNVVNYSKKFENIQAILDRHSSLNHARQEFLERFSDLLGHYGTDQVELSNELKAKQTKLIDCTMKLNLGRSRSDQVQRLNQYQKTNLYKDIQRIEEKHVELTQIKSAIKAIYNRAVANCAKNNKHVKFLSDPTDEQMLVFIEHRFTDLNDVLSDLNAELKKAKT